MPTLMLLASRPMASLDRSLSSRIESDPVSKEVLSSYLRYRKSVLTYSRITELAYMQARMFDFPYPSG